MKKIVLEGTMLAVSEMMGKNRSGLVRVAEEIADNLVALNEGNIYFANNTYFQNFHNKLQDYVLKKYSPAMVEKIISKKPLYLFEVLKLKGLWYKYPWLLFPSVKMKSLDKFDIFHSFYYPFSRKVAKHKITKCITFYDIIPLKRPGNPGWIVNLTQKIVDSIEDNFAISISEFSRAELLEYNRNLDPSRIFVGQLAASKTLFFPNKDEMEWKRVMEKYQLPEQYLFCIASNDPRKNIHHVVKSFDKLVNQERPKDLYLFLAGNSAHGQAVINEVKISDETRSRILVSPVFIDEADLAAIYSNALSFVYMSDYEGFGLPVLEAMQCATPTISSNNTSIPEVVGTAGILIPPKDEDMLAQSMLNVFNSKTLRDELSIKGLKRSEYFSWEKTAKSYAEIFDRISR
ncbi:MAG: glycosyltransferase family 1 protein [Chitinophagaceae bacterium]